VIRWLLDTDICIELIRGKSQPVIARLRTHPPGSVALSAITLAELRFGVYKSSDPDRNRLALLHLLTALPVLPFDDPAADTYGQIRSNFEQQGTPIGTMDTLIAAHALSLNLTLVSNNTREFSRIKELASENWARP
jgi:tRNA(fMet)-specific endonuclease VapC